MIADVDRTIRALLRESLGLADEQIRFDRPGGRPDQTQEARPVLSLYLCDVRENRELRRAEPSVERRGDGTATVRPPALRFDLSYLVTAWAAAPESEHDLLGQALRALLAQPILEPEMLQGGLRDLDLAVPTSVGQPDSLSDFTALWSGLGGIRPALLYSVTVPVAPFPAEERRLVASRLIRVGEKVKSGAELAASSRPDELVEFAGRVVAAADGRPVSEAQVSLREVSRSAAVGAAGIYRIGNLTPGRYTLVVSAPGYREVRREVILTDRSAAGRLGGDFDVKLEAVK